MCAPRRFAFKLRRLSRSGCDTSQLDRDRFHDCVALLAESGQSHWPIINTGCLSGVLKMRHGSAYRWLAGDRGACTVSHNRKTATVNHPPDSQPIPACPARTGRVERSVEAFWMDARHDKVILSPLDLPNVVDATLGGVLGDQACEGPGANQYKIRPEDPSAVTARPGISQRHPFAPSGTQSRDRHE